MYDVLCRVTRIQPWNTGVSYAADLAARVDGAVTGAYVHASPLDGMPRFGSSELFGALLRHAHERLALARACGDAFVEHARALGVRAAGWQIVEGRLAQALARLALCHDVLVLERDGREPRNAAAELARLLLATPLPCIVVPPGLTQARLECVALAWNDSVESIRAIHAAKPLIRRAARVVLLQGNAGTPLDAAGWFPPFSIWTYLERHGIAAQPLTLATTERGAGEALLDAAAQVGADLLVMGAYGRSRLDEWALGGATRTAMAQAPIPLFLRH
jgi:nucleotide-binding universal stress UspA family protein